MHTDLIFWVAFNCFVLIMLALDLGLFNRTAHKVSLKEALTWSLVWFTLAMSFNVIIYFWEGQAKALEFFTGYVIEKSLSVDNIFVFVLIFSYFKTPAIYQHKILFWGIIGALVMRAAFIFAGITMLEKFHWTIYVFGVLLIFTGYRMLTQKEKMITPENNSVIKFFKKIVPVTHEIHGSKFFVKINKKQFATPLFLALIIIEITDLIFAVDSIPAILAITQDRFIVYTSNVFAILGLRSLYFALAGIIDKFHYLATGLAIILIFAGIKMIISDIYKLPTLIALFVIISVLAGSVFASLIRNKKN